MASVLTSHGISVDLPMGWEGRIMVRSRPRVPSVASSRVGEPGERSIGWPGEITNPVVHLANFALPAERGDFGSGAVDLMGAHNVLMVLFEHGRGSASEALFSRARPTVLHASDFSTHRLQRAIPGQAGFQCFFTEAGRAFCLYVVLGWRRNARPLASLATHTLSTITIDAE
jgi:hypothetical protein